MYHLKRNHTEKEFIQSHEKGCWLLVVVLRPIISLGIQGYGWDALRGSLSKGSQPVFTRVSEKTTENSERLGRQARPGFVPGTSRLPVLSATTPPLVGIQIQEISKRVNLCFVNLTTKQFFLYHSWKREAKKTIKCRFHHFILKLYNKVEILDSHNDVNSVMTFLAFAIYLVLFRNLKKLISFLNQYFETKLLLS